MNFDSAKKEEIRQLMLKLRELFAPAKFFTYEADPQKRYELEKTLADPFHQLCAICEELDPHLPYPDKELERSLLPTLTFTQCCMYLLYYMRLLVRQGGTNLFIRLGKEGVTAALITVILNHLEEAEKKDEKAVTLCPQCDAILFPDYRYCPSCGLDLSKHYCLYCTREIPEGSNFCPYCGQKLKDVHKVTFGDTVYTAETVFKSSSLFPDILKEVQDQLAFEESREIMSEEKEELRRQAISRISADSGFSFYNTDRVGSLGYYLGDSHSSQYFYIPGIDSFFSAYYNGGPYDGETNVHDVSRAEGMAVLAESIAYEETKAQKEGREPDPRWEEIRRQITGE